MQCYLLLAQRRTNSGQTFHQNSLEAFSHVLIRCLMSDLMSDLNWTSLDINDQPCLLDQRISATLVSGNHGPHQTKAYNSFLLVDHNYTNSVLNFTHLNNSMGPAAPPPPAAGPWGSWPAAASRARRSAT